MSSTPVAALQDLIRVVSDANSDSRFVLISRSTLASWTLELGLVGEDARWWGTTWKEEALRNIPKLRGTDVRIHQIQRTAFFTDLWRLFLPLMQAIKFIKNAFVQDNLRLQNWDEDAFETPELQVPLFRLTPDYHCCH